MPSLFESLQKANRDMDSAIESALEDRCLDEDMVPEWTAIVRLVADSDRRILRQSGFPKTYEERIKKLHEMITSVYDELPSDSDELNSDATALRSSHALQGLEGIFPELDSSINKASVVAGSKAERYEESLREPGEDKEEEPDSDEQRIATTSLDLQLLFADL